MPEEAISRPLSAASLIISPRMKLICSRASWTVSQMPVPTSTTDWCISALMASCSSVLPFSMISAAICERQIARNRIDGLILFFDTNIEGGFHSDSH